MPLGCSSDTSHSKDENTAFRFILGLARDLTGLKAGSRLPKLLWTYQESQIPASSPTKHEKRKILLKQYVMTVHEHPPLPYLHTPPTTTPPPSKNKKRRRQGKERPLFGVRLPSKAASYRRRNYVSYFPSYTLRPHVGRRETGFF